MSDPRETTDDEWRARLTAAEYTVLREAGTEQAWTGPHLGEHRDGTYRCAGCGAALFASGAKFDSGSGWPSFSAAAGSTALETHVDLSHGMRREEALCAACGGHLGHVFPDGPAPTGLRYCINGCTLAFDPD